MFSKQTSLEKVVAVVDIESDSAGVAIVKTSGKGPATILAAERRSLSFEDRTPRAEVSSMLALLAEAGAKAAASYAVSGKKYPVSECLAVIHTPLSRSVSARASSISKDEIKITPEMIAELARTALSGTTELDKDEIFESGVTRVELNGYQTSAPENKPAHRVTASALASSCNQFLRTSVESSFGTIFPNAKVVMRSGVRAAVSVVHSALGASEECLIVDMTGDATTFIRLDRDMSLEHVVMPEGFRTILKKISAGSLPEEKLSLLRMIEKDDATSESSQGLLSALAQLEPDLLRSCGEALTKLAGVHRLPEELVLIVESDFAPWLSGFFSRIDFTQFTVTMRPFVVRVLEGAALAREVQVGNTKPDTGLAIAAALVNREVGRISAV